MDYLPNRKIPAQTFRWDRQLVSVDVECSTCQVEYPSLLAFLEESIREVESL